MRDVCERVKRVDYATTKSTHTKSETHARFAEVDTYLETSTQINSTCTHTHTHFAGK